MPVGDATLEVIHGGYKSLTLSAQRVRYNTTTELPSATLKLLDVATSPVTVAKDTVNLMGQATHDGVSVVLENSTARFSGVTSADGAWEIPGLLPGVYTLTFAKGEFRETVPQVVALAGANAFVLDEGRLYPMPVIDVAGGQRRSVALNTVMSTPYRRRGKRSWSK